MKTYLNIMVAICLAAFVSQSQAASGISSWTTLFPGIDHAVGWADGAGGDPYLKINCMRIDLANPNIEFVATPRIGWDGSIPTTTTQTTGDFLVEHDVQVAINAQSGSPADGGDWVPRWNQNYESDPSGSLVSHGEIASPADIYSQDLRIDRDNHATIYEAPAPSPIAATVWTAISGYEKILQDGVIVFGETGTGHWYEPNPRQSIGLSADGNSLYLTTVDGRQPGVSGGLNLHDMGQWLLDFGAHDVIELSGGGSATMVKEDGAGGYDFVGIPVGSPYVSVPYEQRCVPANFGVRSRAAGTRAWAGTTGNWAGGSNWDTDTVPYKVDDVVIANGGTARITQVGSCKDLFLGYLGGSGTLELSGDTKITAENYTQSATGTLVAQVDANGVSTINVDNVANLAGTFTVVDLGAAGASYTILTAANGIYGTFDAVNIPAGWSYVIGANSLIITKPAVPIAVEDGSFEGVTTANWGSIPSSGTGWVADEADKSFAAKSSVYNPGYSSAYPQPTPAGSYFCDLYSSSIHQALTGHTYVEGHIYTLAYWAAAGTGGTYDRTYAYFTDGDVNGGAYSNNVIATSGYNDLRQDAVWREFSITHTATAADAGKTIGIAFDGYWYTHVDNVSVFYSEDTDGDSIPNGWETQYYGGVTNADPAAICANDDNTVLEAYIAGFDPTNSLAGFGVVDFSAGGLGHNIINWDEAAGRIYTVYWTTNLLDGFTTTLTNNYSGGIFTDAVHSAESEGFYRLEVEVAP